MDLSQLNKLSKTINTVINPNVYSHDADKINKPMEDIPFGHILNVNWDNIAANYGIIQYFLSQALYLDMVSTEAEANKIVKRGTAGGIQVGDIYSTTGLESGVINAGVGIAFKGADNKLRYDTNLTRLQDVIGIKNPIAGEILSTGNSWNSKIQTGGVELQLTESARKYSAIVLYGQGDPDRLKEVWECAILLPKIFTAISYSYRGNLAATWHKGANVIAAFNNGTDNARVLYALGLF